MLLALIVEISFQKILFIPMYKILRTLRYEYIIDYVKDIWYLQSDEKDSFTGIEFLIIYWLNK